MNITNVNVIFITINIPISQRSFSISIFIQICKQIFKYLVQYVTSKFKMYVMLVYDLESEKMYYNFPINS